VIEQQTSSLTGGSGTIKRLTATSIMIGSAHTTTTCQLTQQSPPLNGYPVGLHVQYLCQNGALSLIGRSAPKKSSIWANRTTWAKGPITTLNSKTLSLRNTLAPANTPAAAVTCALTAASPKVNGYRPGEVVQIFCSHGALTGINRVFR
jgi:hypothetical protein